MPLPFWRFVQSRKNREVASWLGGGAVIAIGGMWGLVTYFFPHDGRSPVAPPPTTATRSSPEVGAGRDIVAGRDVVINVTRFPYLQDKYITNGLLRSGWSDLKPSNELLGSQREPLEIYPTGLFKGGLHGETLTFLIASRLGSHSKVDKLYLKLKAYASCSLRDDTVQRLAQTSTTTKRFFVSEEFDTYPIFPLNENLSVSSWVYKDKDIDEFNIRLDHNRYILYLISINVDYLDLDANQPRHIESDEFSLVDVRGNTGGCLNVKRWFSDDQRIKPRSKSYDHEIPYDAYQLLTEKFSLNPGTINIFLKNRVLVNRTSEIQKVVEARPENPVFRTNYEEWMRLLESVCVAPVGDRLLYRC